jgi:hypothetical protein
MEALAQWACKLERASKEGAYGVCEEEMEGIERVVVSGEELGR